MFGFRLSILLLISTTIVLMSLGCGKEEPVEDPNAGKLTVEEIQLLKKQYDAVIAQCEEVGFEELTEAEQVMYFVWLLSKEVDTGGFDAFYRGSRGRYAKETVEALTKIGAIQTADILEQANGVFEEGVPPEDSEERMEQLNNFSEASNRKLNNLDNEFYKEPDNINKLLHKYVLKNRLGFTKLAE